MGSRGRSCPAVSISQEKEVMRYGSRLYMLGIVYLLLAPTAFAGEISPDCTFRGVPLYGKVKVVDVFADFNVEIVDALCDLDVKFVDALPNQCGEWEFVDTFEDFSVKFVDVFGDFSICNVDALPGLR